MAWISVFVLYNHVEKDRPHEMSPFQCKIWRFQHINVSRKQQFSWERIEGSLSYYNNNLWSKFCEHHCFNYIVYIMVSLQIFCCSVAQSCLTLCNLMDCSTPGFPVHYQLSELAQTHVHWVSDAIQPSHSPSSPSPPVFNLSQHQGLFQWVSSSH